MKQWLRQPPSGGCVLKLSNQHTLGMNQIQPPSGGCVLKPMAERQLVGMQTSRLQAAVC